MMIDLNLFAGSGGWEEGALRVGGYDPESATVGIQPLGLELDRAHCDAARAAGHARAQVDVAKVNPREYGRVPVRGIIASPPGPLAAPHRLVLAVPHLRPDNIDTTLTALCQSGLDARSLLALEPLRYTMALGPRWLAWVAHRSALPLWEAVGERLEQAGYSVAVDPIADRAVLAARSDGKEARLPHRLDPVEGPFPRSANHAVPPLLAYHILKEITS